MDLLHSASHFSAVRFACPHYSPARLRREFFTARASLPFLNQKAKHHRELEAAVHVVERACCLCVDVTKSLFSSEGRIIEKSDQTPVTVADFGVQALVSLELSKLFPSIPLVAEEDSAFIRSNSLADSVVNVVTDKASYVDKPLTNADVLEAIDRGGTDAFSFGTEPATYWVLDPIDGTRGFLKGSEALYVVGLALVVEGEVVLGVMGCPNWQEDFSRKSNAEVQENKDILLGSGIIMAAHVGCGAWTKRLSNLLGETAKISESWTRCFVDGCCLVHEARYCIPDNQTCDLLPLLTLFSATTDAGRIGDKQVVLLPTCCGSLCKYLTVASGRASVFILQVRAQKIIKVWDHAVGIICVHEAGGMVTDWQGSRVDLAADQVGRRIIYPSGGVLVTNGNLHDRILEVISSNSPIV